MKFLKANALENLWGPIGFLSYTGDLEEGSGNTDKRDLTKDLHSGSWEALQPSNSELEGEDPSKSTRNVS